MAINGSGPALKQKNASKQGRHFAKTPYVYGIFGSFHPITFSHFALRNKSDRMIDG